MLPAPCSLLPASCIPDEDLFLRRQQSKAILQQTLGITEAAAHCMFLQERSVHSVSHFTNSRCRWCQEWYTKRWGFGNVQVSSAGTMSKANGLAFIDKHPDQAHRDKASSVCPRVDEWYRIRFPKLSADDVLDGRRSGQDGKGKKDSKDATRREKAAITWAESSADLGLRTHLNHRVSSLSVH